MSKFDIKVIFHNDKGEECVAIYEAQDMIDHYHTYSIKEDVSDSARLQYLNLFVSFKLGLMMEKYCE